MKLPRTPQGEWATRIPAVAEYIATVPAEQVAAWEKFHGEFPQVDPTETAAFYDSTLERRRTLGTELTEKTAAEYAAWIRDAEAMRQALVDARGTHIGIALSGNEDGRSFRLTGFEGIQPVYTFTQNSDAARSTNADKLRTNASFDPVVGTNVSGAGLYITVNDFATVYEHNEFQLPAGGSRILVKKTYDDADGTAHSTHVAGTIGAWGYNTNIMGMAPRVWLRTLVQQAVADISGYGMRYPGQTLDGATTNPRDGTLQVRSAIGSTSLGATDNYAKRGVYSSTSASYDQAMWDNPYYTHFFAAGNDGTPLTPTNSYGTIALDYQVAKNMTTIGAVWDVTRDANGNFTGTTNNYGVYGYSSRGPVYDGRIKPDLVANGTTVTSAGTASNSATNVLSGTSMACPNAAGSAALLVDYFNKRFPGHFPRSSTVRALLVNGADDMGNAGPDYTFGWGVVNVKKAAEIVKRYATNPASRAVVEDSLASGATNTAVYTRDATATNICVTLAWIDPAGASQTAGGATRSARLVNDLNIRVIGPDGTTNYPFVMPFVTGKGTNAAFSPALHEIPAEKGNNTTDNIEQVVIPAPSAGSYTVAVSGAAALSGGSQKYSLAVSGMARTDALAPSVASVSYAVGDGTHAFLLTVNGSGFVIGSNVLLRRDGLADAAAYGHEITADRIVCRVDPSTFAPGLWDVVVRAPDGSEAKLAAALLVPPRSIAYSNDFSSASGLTLEGNWQVGAPNYSSGGPTSAHSGTGILGYNLSGNYPSSMTNSLYAKTPAIDCRNIRSTRLNFWRWLGVERRNYDSATLEVSSDGSNWTNVWSNPSGTKSSDDVQDTAWTLQTYDISSVADGKQTVYVRWAMGPTDSSGEYCGWSIDDVVVAGALNASPPAFTSSSATAAEAGRTISFVVAATDSDTPGTGLQFGASGLPAWLTLTDNGNGTALLSGTPPAEGTADFILQVTDGNYTTYQTASWTIGPATNGYASWASGIAWNGKNNSAEADPDGDNLTNFAEYALGGDPTVPQPSKLPAPGETQVASDKFLTLTFHRARADVTYIVEGSSDLTNPSGWSDVSYTPGAAGEDQTVQDTVPMDGANTKRFLRLRVIAP